MIPVNDIERARMRRLVRERGTILPPELQDLLADWVGWVNDRARSAPPAEPRPRCPECKGTEWKAGQGIYHEPRCSLEPRCPECGGPPVCGDRPFHDETCSQFPRR